MDLKTSRGGASLRRSPAENPFDVVVRDGLGGDSGPSAEQQNQMGGVQLDPISFVRTFLGRRLRGSPKDPPAQGGSGRIIKLSGEPGQSQISVQAKAPGGRPLSLAN